MRIWGSRGSIPCPGPQTVIYGGNTTCVEIRADDRLIIVDLGTGVRDLGNALMAKNFRKGPLDIDIFVSHTHWDHILGFPMFVPLFVSSAVIRIRGPQTFEDDSLEASLRTLLSHRYWPVRLNELAARVEYAQLGETTLDLGDGLRVITKYLNHPVLCLGYRFEYQGKSIVTCFDTEPFFNLFSEDPAAPDYDDIAAGVGETAVKEENEKQLRFFQGADILIYDCPYTEEEYSAKRGWGHSFYEYAAVAGRDAGVKRLLYTHHDPGRTDADLAKLEEYYRERYRGSPWPEIIMAKEGMIVEV